MPDQNGQPSVEELMLMMAMMGMQGSADMKDYVEPTSELGERMAFGPFSGSDFSRLLDIFSDPEMSAIFTPESLQQIADVVSAGTGLELQLPMGEPEEPVFAAEDYFTVGARMPEMIVAAEIQDMLSRGQITEEEATATGEGSKQAMMLAELENSFPVDERMRFLTDNPSLMEVYAQQALDLEREERGPIANEVLDAREAGYSTGYDDLEAVMAANRRPIKTRGVDPKATRRLPTARLGGDNGTTLLLEGEGVGPAPRTGAERVSDDNDSDQDLLPVLGSFPGLATALASSKVFLDWMGGILEGDRETAAERRRQRNARRGATRRFQQGTSRGAQAARAPGVALYRNRDD